MGMILIIVMHIILIEYKNNILRLIYAVAGKELHLQSAFLYSIASNRSISEDGGKMI